MAHRRRMLLGVLAAALFAAAAFSALFLGGVTRRLDLVAYDRFFRLRGARPGTPDIVMVDIDDETVRELGSFPVRREHYAELIRALDRDGCRARALAFDVFLMEPGSDHIPRRKVEDFLARALPKPGEPAPAEAELRARLGPLLAGHDEEIGRAARAHGHVYFPAIFSDPIGSRQVLAQAVRRREDAVKLAAFELQKKQNDDLYSRFLADPWGTRPELVRCIRQSARPAGPGRAAPVNVGDFDQLTIRLIDEENRARTRALVLQRIGEGGLRGFLTGRSDAEFAGDFSAARLRWAKRMLLGEGSAELLWNDYLQARAKDPGADFLATCAASGQTYEKITGSKFADLALRTRLARERSADGAVFLDRAFSAHAAEYPVLPVLDAARTLVCAQPGPALDDGTVRALPLILVQGGRAYPTMGLAVALDVLGARVEDCRFERGDFVVAAAGGRPETRIPVDRQGRALLNWNGPWLDSFRHVPMSKLLGGADASLDGKIVFVGLTASGTHDLNPTPFEARYPMVGAHAELAEGILSDGFIREAGRWPVAGLVCLLALAGALAGAALGRAWAPAAALAGAAAIAAASFGAFAQGRVFIPPVAPLGAFGLAYVAGLFWRYLIAEREGRKVRRAFAYRTSPALVEEMMRNPQALRLGGKRVEATIFLADLAGFTAVAESTSPEELIQLLNEYLSEISEAVIAGGGYLDKYEGDAVMAIFGAPVERADHARAACLAALNAQERLDRLRARLSASGRPLLRCRIGLNSGTMIAGNIGSSTRFDYTALGDAVNLASRIEGANKVYGTRILVSGPTAERAGPGLAFRETDLVRVQGRREPVRILELAGRETDFAVGRRDGHATFARALALYRDRQFQAARDLFLDALAALGGKDGPCETFIGRSQRYLLSPPPEDWDGVFEMTSK